MKISNLLLAVFISLPTISIAWTWKNEGADQMEEDFGLSPAAINADGIPVVELSNKLQMPLVGLGVEYLPPYMVPLMAASALQEDKRTRLFDTAHVTDNEPLLAQGIKQGMERFKSQDGNQDKKIELHVITKVWYTHLGYERTVLSVKESFQTLQEAVLGNPRVDLKVHVLLQWPRCYESISWMNCEEDEQTVAPHVQNAGPPPHMDKDNSWKKSWKALEDMYTVQEMPIASIGVANFHLRDLQEMDQFARIHPHMLQLSVWSLLYDPFLIDYCQRRNIHVQVVDAVDGVLADPNHAPNAHHHLLKVASDLSEGLREEINVSQVILSWLIQHGVSVIPGTARLSELQENSAMSLANVPALSRVQVETLAHAMHAFLSGDDMEEDITAQVTFFAKNKDAMLYWQNPDGGESKIAFIAKGQSFNESTYPKHQFRIYDARNKDNWVDYTVQARFGERASYEAYLD